jgi:hypothetical protein
MTQAAIFGPLFATVLLTFVVWVYMYIRRISFITSNKISSKDLAVPGALAQLSPPAVSNPSDNLKNLFEIPVIFYALATFLISWHGIRDSLRNLRTHGFVTNCGLLLGAFDDMGGTLFGRGAAIRPWPFARI